MDLVVKVTRVVLTTNVYVKFVKVVIYVVCIEVVKPDSAEVVILVVFKETNLDVDFLVETTTYVALVFER